MSEPIVHEFSGREELADMLAARVVTVLGKAIAGRGLATLIVSGGRTPARLFERLSCMPLEWRSVEVLLADERWVPDDHERSNARLLRDRLLGNKARHARFSPLWNGTVTAAEAALTYGEHVSRLARPFDAVILGMGEDGHTASLFPDAPELDAAMGEGAAAAAVMSPKTQPEVRISLTPAVLVDCRFLALHIEGAGKRDVLERALGYGPASELPVRTILRNDKVTPEVYWCP